MFQALEPLKVTAERMGWKVWKYNMLLKHVDPHDPSSETRTVLVTPYYVLKSPFDICFNDGQPVKPLNAPVNVGEVEMALSVRPSEDEAWADLPQTYEALMQYSRL